MTLKDLLDVLYVGNSLIVEVKNCYGGIELTLNFRDVRYAREYDGNDDILSYEVASVEAAGFMKLIICVWKD